MEDVISIRELKKGYGNFHLNLSFDIKAGYITGFIGSNGSGKTTTIKLIMNLIKKNGGNIEVFGKDNIEFEKQIKEQIGFVYDEPAFYDNIMLKDMTKLYKPFYKDWDDEMYKKFVCDFELDENKKIKELSKGTGMKYSIALALSHHPKLVIMDEPTAGLDPVFRRHILDILQDFVAKEETSIFFSTHITSDLERVADYITFINEGKLIFSGEKDNMFEDYVLVKGDAECLTDETVQKFIGMKKSPHGFEALTKKDELAKLQISSIVTDVPTLEDIMYYHKTK